jgi:cell division protein FtsW (lipid II flippase)
MYKKTIDPYLVFIVMALVIFGVVMISSVSVYPSFKITSQMVAKGILSEPSNSFYLTKNFMHVSISILSLIFFTKFPYTILERWSRLILAGVFAVMIVVLIV